MSDFDVRAILRPHLNGFAPYASARDDFSGDAAVYLDANENALGSATAASLNRYPDPHQRIVKTAIGDLTGTDRRQVFVGNGSDEAIDLLVHAFCEPTRDHIVVTPPTYGMYAVSAAVNGVAVRNVPLDRDFRLDAGQVIAALDDRSKLVFLCSPNNPTGNAQDADDILAIAAGAPGLVVVDEAYVEFAPETSVLPYLDGHPNLVVLRTFSKAWGMAAARLGFAFADPAIIDVFDAIKMPYNVSQLSLDAALEAIENAARRDAFVEEIVAERAWLAGELATVAGVRTVFSSDANFLLTSFDDADGVHRALLDAGVIVRNRSTVTLCEDSLRITVGTRAENTVLLDQLRQIGSRR